MSTANLKIVMITAIAPLISQRGYKERWKMFTKCVLSLKKSKKATFTQLRKNSRNSGKCKCNMLLNQNGNIDESTIGFGRDQHD